MFSWCLVRCHVGAGEGQLSPRRSCVKTNRRDCGYKGKGREKRNRTSANSSLAFLPLDVLQGHILFVFLIFIFYLAEAEGGWEAIASHSERLQRSLFNLEHVCCETHSGTDRLLRDCQKWILQPARVCQSCYMMWKGTWLTLEAEQLPARGREAANERASCPAPSSKRRWSCLVPCQVWECMQGHAIVLVHALNYRIKWCWSAWGLWEVLVLLLMLSLQQPAWWTNKQCEWQLSLSLIS